jgi:hypothetical protein
MDPRLLEAGGGASAYSGAGRRKLMFHHFFDSFCCQHADLCI